MMQIAWDDHEVEAMKGLYGDGLSMSQIARALGTGRTRNAVLGKLHRLGLVDPSRKMPRQPRVASAPRARNPHTPTPLSEPEPAFEPMLVNGEPVTVFTITDQMCHWPIGDPLEPAFQFCGHAPMFDSPYCPFHRKIAYEPMKQHSEMEDRAPKKRKSVWQ